MSNGYSVDFLFCLRNLLEKQFVRLGEYRPDVVEHVE